MCSFSSNKSLARLLFTGIGSVYGYTAVKTIVRDAVYITFISTGGWLAEVLRSQVISFVFLQEITIKRVIEIYNAKTRCFFMVFALRLLLDEEFTLITCFNRRRCVSH